MVTSHRAQALGLSLETLADNYQDAKALGQDPLAVPLAYPDPWDRELAAWVAAPLAYGRVAPMLRAIRGVLAPMGPTPSVWLRTMDPHPVQEHLNRALNGWVWRFHTAADMVAWLLAWKQLDHESGERGLEPHFLPSGGQVADKALSTLVQRLRNDLPQSPGIRFSLPDPLQGSACKRWRIFLRWMVREGWPDLGQWHAFPKESLVIPLDTHVARISRMIGLTSRSTSDGRMATEITQALKKIDPVDPLRFDFALSHLGILGDCQGMRALPGCAPCPLAGLCLGRVTKRKTRADLVP